MVNALRAAGFDVLWICESASGASDTRVLAMANAEERVLLTFDKDFGDLAWRGGVSAACGVILFRLPMPPATSIGPALVARVRERDDWIGSFSVVETWQGQDASFSKMIFRLAPKRPLRYFTAKLESRQPSPP